MEMKKEGSQHEKRSLEKKASDANLESNTSEENSRHQKKQKTTEDNERSTLSQSLSHMPQFDDEASQTPEDDSISNTSFLNKREHRNDSLTMFSKSSSHGDRKHNKKPQPSVKTFFKEVISHFTHRKPKFKTVFIIITHTLPTIPDFLDGMSQIPNCRVAGLVLKSSIRDPKTLEKLKKRDVKLLNFDGKDFNTEIIDKEKLHDDPKVALKIIDENVLGGEKAIIIDTGGYFTSFIKAQIKTDKLLGIVEDTENGHQKYEKVEKLSLYPIFSVARGELKKGEDYNVGKAIKQATDTLLRQALDERLEDHEVAGVIGFGKIGSAIAEHLSTTRIVMVHDRNALVSYQAASRDCKVVDKEDILQHASIIFCATGNKCLSKKDFENFGCDRVILSSCTSADDELDLTGLGKPHHVCKEYTEYRFKTGPQENDYTTVILLVGGNAVNFYYKAIVGNSIRGVQASLMACALRLMFEKFDNTQTIHTLEYKEEYSISKLWLQEFSSIRSGVDHNLPARNNNFVGRKTQMITIFKQLYGKTYDSFKTSNNKVLLHGKSGFGKKQTALEFAWRNLEYYSFVWWIDAEHGVAQAYNELARHFGIESYGKTFSEIAKEIPVKLRTQPDFLLIFDNVNDYAQVSELLDTLSTLGNGRRHIMCISNENMPEFDSENQILIEKFSEQSSRRYIRRKMLNGASKVKIDLNGSSQLATTLEHHPLYLEKSTAFMKQIKLSPEMYLQKITPGMEKESVYSVILSESIKYLESINKEILHAVIICSFLYGDRIPEPLLYELLSSKMQDPLISTAINQMLNFELFKTLGDSDSKRASLPRPGQRHFYMHKITQAIIRKKYLEANQADSRKYCTMAVNTMTKKFKYEYYGQRTKTPNGRIISQLHTIVDNVMSLEPNDFREACYELTMRLASYHLNEYRNYQASHDCAQKALKIKPDDAKAMHMVAINMLYMKPERLSLGNSLDEKNVNTIEKLAKAAHDIFKKSEEPHHQLYQAETLITLSYVQKYRCKCAESVADKINLISQAENKLREASSILQEYSHGGKTDAPTRVEALLYHARGDVYLIQGSLIDEQEATTTNEKYSKAVNDFSMAITKRTKILGEEHVDLARSQYKYSLALARLGRLREAEEFCMKAVELQKKAFIAPHSNLTDSLKALSKIRKAMMSSSTQKIPSSPSTQKFGFH